MSDSDKLAFLNQEAQLIHLQREALNGGGGGGTSGGMEPRVAKLEAHVEHILSGISDLKAATQALSTSASAQQQSLATLTERVNHLPTKENLSNSLRNWVVGVGGVLTLINVGIIILARIFAPGS